MAISGFQNNPYNSGGFGGTRPLGSFGGGPGGPLGEGGASSGGNMLIDGWDNVFRGPEKCGSGGLPPQLAMMMEQLMESLMGSDSSQSGGAGDDQQYAEGGPGDDNITQIGDGGCGNCQEPDTIDIPGDCKMDGGPDSCQPPTEVEPPAEAKGGNSVLQRGGWGADSQTVNAKGGNNSITQRGGRGNDHQVVNLS